MSVGHNREPDKTAEPIDVPFRTWTPVGPGSHALGGGARIAPREAAILGIYFGMQSNGRKRSM